MTPEQLQNIVLKFWICLVMPLALVFFSWATYKVYKITMKETTQ